MAMRAQWRPAANSIRRLATALPTACASSGKSGKNSSDSHDAATPTERGNSWEKSLGSQGSVRI